MAYDEHLADRVRAVVARGADVTERKMFGGLAFLLGGHMFAGIAGSELMVGLGYQAAQQPSNTTTSGRWTSLAAR